MQTIQTLIIWHANMRRYIGKRSTMLVSRMSIRMRGINPESIGSLATKKPKAQYMGRKYLRDDDLTVALVKCTGWAWPLSRRSRTNMMGDER